MQITTLNTRDMNEKLKASGYRGWSFEYDSTAKRYCLSIFDSHNPEDELVFFLHAFEPNIISHAIRFKKDNTQNSVDKKHFFYLKAEEIVANFI